MLMAFYMIVGEAVRQTLRARGGGVYQDPVLTEGHVSLLWDQPPTPAAIAPTNLV